MNVLSLGKTVQRCFPNTALAMNKKARCYLNENNHVWLAMLASFARLRTYVILPIIFPLIVISLPDLENM